MLTIKSEKQGIDDREPPLYEAPPLSNRWWLFIMFLWTVVLVAGLVAGAPLLLSRTMVERPLITQNIPQVAGVPGITSMTLYEKKSPFDWTDRLSQYELEIVQDGQPRRYPWPDQGWLMGQKDGVLQFSSTDGKVIMPLTSAGK